MAGVCQEVGAGAFAAAGVGLVAVGAVATLIAISAGEVLTPTALVYAVLTRVAAVWAIATLGLALTVQFRRRP